jgi:HAD superfamily hydrolase (TIGR01509 family)
MECNGVGAAVPTARPSTHNPLRAILFDMDGVLIDSEPHYVRADEKLFERLGIPFGEDEVRAITGSNNEVVADLIVSWHPRLKPRRDEIAALYEDSIYTALKAEVAGLIPGAMAWVLKAKAAGLKVAIGSSSSARMVFHIAESLGLAPLMDTIVTGDMVSRGKPSPEIYLRCCENLGLRPEACVVIEDSANGLRSGRAAGTRCAAFHGTNRFGIDLSDCDFSFDAFTDEAWERHIAPLMVL